MTPARSLSVLHSVKSTKNFLPRGVQSTDRVGETISLHLDSGEKRIDPQVETVCRILCTVRYRKKIDMYSMCTIPVYRQTHQCS